MKPHRLYNLGKRLKEPTNVPRVPTSPKRRVQPVDVPNPTGLANLWSRNMSDYLILNYTPVIGTIDTGNTSNVSLYKTYLLDAPQICICGHIQSSHRMLISDWDNVVRESCVECYYD